MTEILVMEVGVFVPPEVPEYSPPAVFEEEIGVIVTDTILWRHDELREAFLKEYGGCCACCGEDTQRFLTMDHIYNDGRQERDLYGNTHGIIRRLMLAGWPKGRHRILCYNCNIGRAHNGGVCPHEQ